MFLVLVGQKLRSSRNSLTGAAAARRAPFLLLAAAFWFLLYSGTDASLGLIRRTEYFGDLITGKLFALLFYSLSAFLVLSNVVTALSSFYLSRDLPFLLSKPLPVREILRIKTLEAVFNSSWMVLVFTPPVLAAFGANYRAPWGYYLLLVPALAAFSCINAGIGIAVAHLLTRIFPAGSSRDLILGSGIVVVLVLYFAAKSLIPQQPADGDLFGPILRFRADSPFFPHSWVTGCLYPFLQQRGPDWLSAALLASNAGFSLLVSSTVGKVLYVRNIERLQPAGSPAGSGKYASCYPGRAGALPYKDVKVFFRDTAQWSQLIIIAALVMVYVANFKSLPLEALSGLTPHIKEIIALLNLSMAGLILTAVAGRFLYTAVSLEGQAFWILRASPLEPRSFLRMKCFHAGIPLLLLIVLLVWLTNKAVDGPMPLFILSLLTAAGLSVSVSGLGTGLGALAPDFGHENIASVSMSIGGMTFMVIAFTLVICTLLLESTAYYLLFMKTGGPAPWEVAASAACAVFTVALNWLAFYLPMKMAEQRLWKREDF